MSTSKQRPRFERVGATASTGYRHVKAPPEVPATRKVHVAIDDATRLPTSKCWLA